MDNIKDSKNRFTSPIGIKDVVMPKKKTSKKSTSKKKGSGKKGK